MSDNWIHQVGSIKINIPELDRVAKAINRIADELEKANNKSGKHVEGEDNER